MDFNINTLTLNEIELIEDITGKSIEQIIGDENPRGKALKAIALVILRRNDPTVTAEKAGELTLTEIMDLLSGGGSGN